MNGRHLFGALAAVLVLASCGDLGGGGGRVVSEPTVEEMARIDREMGLETKTKNSSRTYVPDNGGGAPTAQAPVYFAPPQPAPTTLAPPQQAPPTHELPPSSTIQKLR